MEYSFFVDGSFKYRYLLVLVKLFKLKAKKYDMKPKIKDIESAHNGNLSCGSRWYKITTNLSTVLFDVYLQQ